MCGRYSLFAAPDEVSRVFGLSLDEVERVFSLRPRYNIAPTDTVLAVRTSASGDREPAALRWGLIPSWAKSEDFGARTINARAETAATKPAFRDSLRSRRCLLPASGFYEWQRLRGGKQPYHFTVKGAEVFGLAGLWDRWEPLGQPAVESCTIITTRPNSVTRPIHDRMPVILEPETFDRWLDPEAMDTEFLAGLLRPYPGEKTIGHPVSPAVSRPGNDGPELIEPVGSPFDEPLELDLG